MSDIQPHAIFAEDENGHKTHQIAWVEPAEDADVQRVLAAPLDTTNGRSRFFWMRLQDNTLLLGVFPQGDTYCEFETCGEWKNADGSPCLG